MAKKRLGQLLKEPFTDFSEKDRDLVLIFLLLEAGVIEKNYLSRSGQGRQVTIVVPRLHSLALAYPTTPHFATKHGTKAEYEGLERHALNCLIDQGEIEPSNSMLER